MGMDMLSYSKHDKIATALCVAMVDRLWYEICLWG